MFFFVHGDEVSSSPLKEDQSKQEEKEKQKEEEKQVCFFILFVLIFSMHIIKQKCVILT